MKTMTYLASPLATQSLTASEASPLAIELTQPVPNGSRLGEPLRHILLGSPRCGEANDSFAAHAALCGDGAMEPDYGDREAFDYYACSG